jgi:hypothetical protein
MYSAAPEPLLMEPRPIGGAGMDNINDQISLGSDRMAAESDGRLRFREES